MKNALTLCVVGAGGSYTSEIIAGLLSRPDERLPVRRVALMDIDAGHLSIMAGLSRRMIAAAGRDIQVVESTDLRAMLEGADFVITQVRVGGMPARVLDETIPARHGVIGQETTGPGGMFKALRTVPVMLDVAHAVEAVCPDAVILNYTNPSGIIAEAVSRHSKARCVGLCSGIPGMIDILRNDLRDRWPDLRVACVGLNHLGFIHRLLSGDRDVTAEGFERLVEQKSSLVGDGRWLRLFGAIPIGYLHFYTWRPWAHKEWAPPAQTRAQAIMEMQKDLYAQAADPAQCTRPEVLNRRGGVGYANVTLAWLDAILHDTGAELVGSVANRGCVDGIDADAVVEIACRVGAGGPVGLPVGAIPQAFRGLVQAVKAYETLTVQAAVTRDRRTALQALVTHPLVGDLDLAEAILDDMLKAHRLLFH